MRILVVMALWVFAACSNKAALPDSDAGKDSGGGACPEGVYKQCQADTDCKCTHRCLALVPNGVNKYCTIPCTTSADCNHDELGIGCTPSAQCCQANNACLPSP